MVLIPLISPPTKNCKIAIMQNISLIYFAKYSWFFLQMHLILKINFKSLNYETAKISVEFQDRLYKEKIKFP